MNGSPSSVATGLRACFQPKPAGRDARRYFGRSILALIGASIATAAPAPLADAVERKDHSTIRAIARDTDVNAPQTDGMTALHWAVYHDDGDTAKLLLGSGANANAENRYGVTPLSLACTNGNAALVELLLAAGANPNAPLRGGETPLMTAARTGMPCSRRSMLM